jgi:hypothetical protein
MRLRQCPDASDVNWNMYDCNVWFCLIPVEEMDQYLGYIGGPAGALALTGVAAASAFYLASRPTPQKPLVELHCQSRLLPVSTAYRFIGMLHVHKLGAVTRLCSIVVERSLETGVTAKKSDIRHQGFQYMGQTKSQLLHARPTCLYFTSIPCQAWERLILFVYI